MFSPEVINMIILGIGQTLYMVILSTLFGYVLGLPWGITLAVTNKEGIRPLSARVAVRRYGISSPISCAASPS